MESENDRNLFDSCFEFVIYRISENEEVIEEFDNDNLFRNIYLFYCFSRYLSLYYHWEKKAMMRLKQNIIVKWPTNDFCNVFLFIEMLSRGYQKINPINFFWHSEEYFEHLLRIKDELNQVSYKCFFRKGNIIR